MTVKPFNASTSVAGLRWVKSSYSGNNGNCVEVGELPHVGHTVRDTKNHERGQLSFATPAWQQFVSAVRHGVFPRTR